MPCYWSVKPQLGGFFSFRVVTLDLRCRSIQMRSQNVVGVLVQFLGVVFLIPEFPVRVVLDPSPQPGFRKSGVLSAPVGPSLFPQRAGGPEQATINVDELCTEGRADGLGTECSRPYRDASLFKYLGCVSFHVN